MTGGASSPVVVLCTAPAVAAPGGHGAAELARALVAERLCACVNVVPGVQSWFWWEGKVDCADEQLLVIKTTRAAVPRLQTRLLELHPYEVPEFLALDVAAGSPRYLAWLAAAVGNGAG